MPNFLYPMCALMGHDWVRTRTTANWTHFECNLCDRRRKDPR